MDPYASEKLAMLDRTRDQRVEIGKVYRREQLSHSAELMQANLARLWATTQDVAARKETVFALWDECAEPTGKEGDHEGEAGTKARIIVVAFIRTHAPAGSAAAFTPDEIARLDAHRSSRQHFAPYAE